MPVQSPPSRCRRLHPNSPAEVSLAFRKCLPVDQFPTSCQFTVVCKAIALVHRPAFALRKNLVLRGDKHL